MSPSWQEILMYVFISVLWFPRSAKEHFAQVVIVSPPSLIAKLLIIFAICDLISVSHIFAFWIVFIVVIPFAYARRYALLSSVE